MERVARDGSRPSSPAAATTNTLIPRQRKTDWTQAPASEASQNGSAGTCPQPAPQSRYGDDATPAVLQDLAAPLPGRRFGPKTIVFAGIVSALIGAGLTLQLKRPPLPAVVSSAPAKPAMAVSATSAVPAPVALTENAKPVPDNSESQVRNLVEGWRQAWTQRDVEAYLRCYSQNFVPADGQSRANWENARRKKLSSKSDISVKLNNINIERIADDQIKVFFFQDYAAGTYHESARLKMLMMTRTEGDWKITGEWQLK